MRGADGREFHPPSTNERRIGGTFARRAERALLFLSVLAAHIGIFTFFKLQDVAARTASEKQRTVAVLFLRAPLQIDASEARQFDKKPRIADPETMTRSDRSVGREVLVKPRPISESLVRSHAPVGALMAPTRTEAASEPNHAVPPADIAEDAGPHAPLKIDSETIRKAVRSTQPVAGRTFDMGVPETQAQRLSTGIREAGKPDCLRPDALKHEPLQLGGLLGLPLLAHAMAAQKCN